MTGIYYSGDNQSDKRFLSYSTNQIAHASRTVAILIRNYQSGTPSLLIITNPQFSPGSYNFVVLSMHIKPHNIHSKLDDMVALQ
jgi:hypothetical protein